ncbi:MAG: hypothetical protein AAGG01_09030 [Planctomycetota bacterium]
MFIYTLGAYGWSLSERIPGRVPGGNFGQAVSLNNGLLTVTAPSVDNGASGPRGELYTFEFLAGCWKLSQTLRPSPGAGSGGSFPKSFVSDEDWMFVDIAGRNVDVYRRIAGAWAHHSVLTSPLAGSTSPAFGEGLCMSDGVVAISDASGGAGLGGGRSGSVFIYTFDGSDWIQQQQISSGVTGPDRFGASLSMSDDRLLVGVPQHSFTIDPGGNSAAWLFTENAAGDFTFDRLIEREGSFLQQSFGNEVLISRDDIFVSDIFGGVAPALNAGTVYHQLRPIGRSFCSPSVASEIGRLVLGRAACGPAVQVVASISENECACSAVLFASSIFADTPGAAGLAGLCIGARAFRLGSTFMLPGGGSTVDIPCGASARLASSSGVFGQIAVQCIGWTTSGPRATNAVALQ